MPRLTSKCKATMSLPCNVEPETYDRKGAAAEPATPEPDPSAVEAVDTPRVACRTSQPAHSWILEPPVSRGASDDAAEPHAPAAAFPVTDAALEPREEPAVHTENRRKPEPDPRGLILDLLDVCRNVAREAHLADTVPPIDRRLLDVIGDLTDSVAASPQVGRLPSGVTSALLGEDTRQSEPHQPAVPTSSAKAAEACDTSHGTDRGRLRRAAPAKQTALARPTRRYGPILPQRRLIRELLPVRSARVTWPARQSQPPGPDSRHGATSEVWSRCWAVRFRSSHHFR